MDKLTFGEADLKALTLRPDLFGLYSCTIDDNELDEKLPLDNGLHEINPSTGLGSLDRLPLEILAAILVQIDLQSLTDFRRVNQRATEIVNSIPQYHDIVENAPDALRALLAVRKGRTVSCQDLHNKLCMWKCETCKNFGGFLYLITLRRSCLVCFSMSPYCFPCIPSEARQDFSLEYPQLQTVEQMFSLPGCYSPVIRDYRGRMRLYDYTSLLKIELETHRHKEGHAGRVRSQIQNIRDRWELQDSEGPEPSRPSINRYSFFENPFERQPERHMATVRFPHLDLSTRKLESGFMCKGCTNAPIKVTEDCDIDEDYFRYDWCWARRLFNMETFRDHVKFCQHLPQRNNGPSVEEHA